MLKWGIIHMCREVVVLEFRLRRRGDEKVLREILGSIYTQQKKDSYTDNRNLHRIVLKAYFSVFLSPAALVERFFFARIS